MSLNDRIVLKLQAPAGLGLLEFGGTHLGIGRIGSLNCKACGIQGGDFKPCVVLMLSCRAAGSS